ncbi:MAG: pyridoxal phosphate-dependent aminotransferase [Brasilonema sp.]
MDRLGYFQEYWKHINAMEPALKSKVIDLGMGMPNPRVFKTPKIILDKLHESIDKGDYNLYIPSEGDVECLEEIAKYENASLPFGAKPYTIENVMLVPGGIQAFSLITEALLEKEDEILVPNPSYFSLAALSELRFKTRIVPDEQFNFSYEVYRKYLTKYSKLAWFCHPNNPTGLYIKPEQLGRIIDLAQANGTYVILDESCDNYVFGDRYEKPDTICSSNVVRIKTFSKEPNLAGYRLGYLLADKHLINRFKNISPVLYGNPTVMANRAITTELRIKNGKIQDENYDQVVKENEQRIKINRDFMYEQLKKKYGVYDIILPDACYYMFVQFKFASGSLELYKGLLYEELLNVVPGVVFGMPEKEAWVRICFAREHNLLLEGLKRIDSIIQRHSENKNYLVRTAKECVV